MFYICKYRHDNLLAQLISCIFARFYYFLYLAHSAYSGLFLRPLGNFSHPLRVFDFMKFIDSRSNRSILPVNSASSIASLLSFPSQRVQYRRDCQRGQSSANKAPALVRVSASLMSPKETRNFLFQSWAVRFLNSFVKMIKVLSFAL